MDDLKFIINDTKLSSQGNFSRQSRFKFELKGDPNNYKDCKMVAVFERNREEYAIPIKEDCSCELPIDLENSTYFRFRVVREKDGLRSTTNTILINKEV